MPHLTALTTLLAVLLYFVTGILVARARAKTGVQVPATSGHPDFDRAFRVQMNTLEWMPIFLPSMWLTALYVGDAWAALGGLIWIVGRILYIRGYSQAAKKRGLGFGIQAMAANVMWVASLVAVVMTLMGAH